MENPVKFFKEHKEFCTIVGLCIVFYFLFFHNIGTYALMDIDETRYVTMARDMFNRGDYLTLYLNGEYFFEKPPLYFWMECLSFGLFHKVTEFTARFPVSMCGTICAFLTYFVGRKVVSRRFGVISALILATSIEFLILAKFAILDIVLTVFVLLSVYSGFMTYFCQESNKKYFWWAFYLFSGLAVMAKGIPGFVLPFGTMFFASIFTKRFKEIFKPVFMLPGIALFLLVILPWHIIMFNVHNPLFFNEYVIKHHLHRFVNSQDLGRKEPFYFFLLVVLWGFIPWIFSFIASGIEKFKEITTNFAEKLNFQNLDDTHKFLYLNVIFFLFTMLFFSSSSTKLVTYIISVYMPLAFLCAYVWQNYIEKEESKKSINISANILGGICLSASVVAMFTHFFLPFEIELAIYPAKWFLIALLFVFGLVSIMNVRLNNRMGLFVSYVAFVVVLSAFGTAKIFNVDYHFGQNDLMKYARYAKENNKQVMTLGFRQKYCLIYYGEQHVIYSGDLDYNLFREKLNDSDYVVILRNKNIPEITENEHKFEVIDKGVKYSLVRGLR